MSTFAIIPSASMDALEREVAAVLVRVMVMSHSGNAHHPDVVWLYDWLVQPERTPEEFHHVVDILPAKLHGLVDRCIHTNNDDVRAKYLNDLQYLTGPLPEEGHPLFRLFMNYGNNEHGSKAYIYIFRAAAEALAARNTVLVGPWSKAAWNTCLKLGEQGVPSRAKPSLRLSNWVIQVVGDPDMCPDLELRLLILSMYRTSVKINKHNREQAFESLISACSYLPDSHTDHIIPANNVVGCLKLFTKYKDWEQYTPEDLSQFEDNYLYKFGLRVALKLKKHREMRQYICLHDISHEYSMGLKISTDLKELRILTTILNYIRMKAQMEYKEYQEDYDEYQEEYNEYILESNEQTAGRLLFLYRMFKTALQDPLLLDATIEAIVGVLEAVVMVTWEAQKEEGGDVNADGLYHIDSLLREFCYDHGRADDFCYVHGYYPHPDECTCEVDKKHIRQEIMRRYKGKILKMRDLIDKDFIKTVHGCDFLHFFLYKEAL